MLPIRRTVSATPNNKHAISNNMSPPQSSNRSPHSSSSQTHTNTHNHPYSSQSSSPQSTTSQTSSSSSSILITNTQKSFTPITKHYNLNNTLHDAFFKILPTDVTNIKRYKLALSIGLQYCRVSLFDIPTHGYYNSPKYRSLKVENAKKVLNVSCVLCDDVIVSILNDDMVRENVKMVMKKQQRDNSTAANTTIAKNNGKNGVKAKAKAGNGETSTVITGTLDLLDKIDEAKLLRDVAKENWKIIKSGGTGSGGLGKNNFSFLSYNNKTSVKKQPTATKQQQVQQQQKQQGQKYNDSTANNGSNAALSSSFNGIELQRSDSFVKKEVVKIDDDDDMPRWLRIIDCGGDSMINNICGGSSKSLSSLPIVTTTTTTSTHTANNTNIGTKKATSNNNHQHQGKTTVPVPSSKSHKHNEEKTQEMLSPLKEKIQNRYGKKVHQFQFSRTTSAPADLGNDEYLQKQQLHGEEQLKHKRKQQQKPKEESVNDEMAKRLQQQQQQQQQPEPQSRNISSTMEESKEIVTTSTQNDENAQYESDLQRALYLSGLEFQSTNASSSTLPAVSNDEIHHAASKYNEHESKNLKKIENDEVIDVQTLAVMYKEDFLDMQRNNDIDVSYVNTYQGRIPGSLNGCTVIAPLLAIHYLCDDKVLSERSEILMEGIGAPTSTADTATTTDATTINNHGQEQAPHDSTKGASTSTNTKNQASTAEEEEKNDQSVVSSSHNRKGINNETIRAVIDIQAPIVLPKVRGGLGLHPDALIIPSDVHDFLMKLNMLKQNQFVDVCTGNILDDAHLFKFVETLAGTIGSSDNNDSTASTSGSTTSNKKKNGVDKNTPNKNEINDKLAATFFFHEHVISIHKITRRTSTNLIHQDDDASIESRKKEATSTTKRRLFSRFGGNRRKQRLQQQKQQRNVLNDIPEYEATSDEETWFEIIDSLPGVSMLGHDYTTYMKRNKNNNKKQISHQEDHNPLDGDQCWLNSTARIRCNGLGSLHGALRWYACSKFTFDDQKFINTYHWDHLNMDFDPRVFQAFIWSAE